MATLDYAEALLKDVFLPTIIKLENEHTMLSARLKRTARDIRGDEIISPTMVQGEQGISTRGKNTEILSASPAAFLYAKVGLTHHYGALELYGQDRIMSEGNSNERVAAILATKVASLAETFATDMNRQYWGNGSGILSTTGVTTASAVIEVNNMQYFRLGMRLDVWDESGSAYLVEDSKVIGLDYANSTVTISDAITTAAADEVYRTGNKGLEIEGLQKMIANDNTYLNIDRTSDEGFEWQSYVKDFSAAALTLDVLDEVFGNLISTRYSKPSVLYTDEETVRWIKKLHQATGIPLDYMNIELGYKAIAYNHPKGRTPIVIEPYCPDKNMYILDERWITIRQPQPVHWMPGYSGKFWRLVENFDKEVAHLRYYNQLFNVNPKTCGRFHNYTVPV